MRLPTQSRAAARTIAITGVARAVEAGEAEAAEAVVAIPSKFCFGSFPSVLENAQLNVRPSKRLTHSPEATPRGQTGASSTRTSVAAAMSEAMPK